MKRGNQFVIIRKIETKNNNGDIISQPFDIDEIEKTIGKATIDKESSYIKYENGEIFLVLVCKESSDVKTKNYIQAGYLP